MENVQNVVAIALIFGIPCVAVIGGIIAAIIRIRGQHRLMELALRERIAAIERGIDPPPMTPEAFGIVPPREANSRRAQGLMIGGLLTIAIGVGLMLALPLLPPGDGRENWPSGIIPICIGIALLVASRLVRKSGGDDLDRRTS